MPLQMKLNRTYYTHSSFNPVYVLEEVSAALDSVLAKTL